MTHARRLLTAIAATASLGGCVAIAPPMTEQEHDIAQSVDVTQYMPAGREMRDNIETQELFAQAAFWSHEYDLNPSDLEAAIKLAAAVRKLGNPARAVEITQTSRAIHPRDPYLLAEHAAALIADERALDAVPVLDLGLRMAPQYARLWSLKGAALDQMEDYGPARQHYARALQITPGDPNILANLGLSHALSGDPATAERWLRQAAAQPGAGAGVRQNLALVLQLQGKTEDSQRQLRTARQSRGDQKLPRPGVPALSPRGQAPMPMAAGTAPRGALPQTRLTTTTATGQQFRSSAEAARAAAQQSQGFTPSAAEAVPPAALLDRIARNVGPQRAVPQGAPTADRPHVVGPTMQAPPYPAPPMAVPHPQGVAGPAPYAERRGAARRRR